MTISSTTRKAGPFTGNGIAVAFPFAYKVFSAADLLVVQAVTATSIETIKTLTTDYSVALNADQDSSPGGTINMWVAPPVGATLTLSSQVANLQPVLLTNSGGFYPKVINDSLDRATVQIQQLAEKVSRSVGLAISTPAGVSAALPPPLASAILGWDPTGTLLANYSGSASVGVSAAMVPVVGSATLATARTALGAGVTGASVFVAPDAATARTALGAGVTGASVFVAPDAATARTALGAGVTGASVFVAPDAATARTALGAAAAGANSDITSLNVFTAINGGQLAGLRNRIINGAMNTDQRNSGGAIVVTAERAVLDRYAAGNAAGAGTLTVQQSTMTGFGKSCKVVATSAMTGLTTTNYVRMCQQIIEAQNCFDLNGKTVTLSFKAETNWTGNLGVALKNFNDSRSYLANVAVVAGVNTCSVTVPLEATTIATNDNTSGLKVDIGFCNEGTYQTTTTGSWIPGTYMTSTTSTQWCKTTGNFVNITQVQLEQGSVATAFEQRPIGLEFLLCQRYYWQPILGANNYIGVGQAFSASTAYAGIVNPVRMRSAPTVNAVATMYLLGGASAGTAVFSAQATDSFVLSFSGTFTANNAAMLFQATVPPTQPPFTVSAEYY